MKTGIELISDERERQIKVEGWSAENDAQYENEELICAAACYLSAAATFSHNLEDVPWPFAGEWFKHTTPVRDLTKAGALIAAEIDRIQRLQAATK